jgi:hypothetical protein
LGTPSAHRSSYHPQSDGQTKIVNKFLEGYLPCFVSDKQTQWFKWLPLVEWWYNTSFHTATKMTPFRSLYGYHPPSITSSLKEKSKVQAVEYHIKHRQQVLQLLKDNLTMAQNHMKQQVDQHRSERGFEARDWVFLILKPYKHMSLKQANKDNKLSPKYYGPYKVLQNTSTEAPFRNPGLGLWAPFQPSEVLNLRSFTYDNKTGKIMQEQVKKVPTTQGMPILVLTQVPITRDVRENPIATATTGTTFMSANEDNIRRLC